MHLLRSLALMAPGDRTPGRRVDSIDDLHRPGDYCLGTVVDGEAEHPRIAFLLPTADRSDPWWGAPPHSGLHMIWGRWTITEESDGTVTASPSIGCGKSPYYWHGYLERGVWREV